MTILREQKDVDDQHDPPMLNLEMWITLKNEAISALRFRDVYETPPENPQNQAQATEYLRAGLLRVRTDEDFYSQVLLVNSTRLRASEDSLRTGLATR